MDRPPLQNFDAGRNAGRVAHAGLDFVAGMNFESLPATLQAKIIFEPCLTPGLAGKCWVWQTGLNEDGYGRVDWVGLRNRMAHKVVYQLLVGAIPEGLETDHLCRVHSCVNPAHLEMVTHKENLARGFGVGVHNAARTHCCWGHEFTAENTYHVQNRRRCRPCQNIRQHAYLERKNYLDMAVAAD